MVFETHVTKVLGRKLARSGRSRQLMVDGELWDIFTRCFVAYRSGRESSFHSALANHFSGEHPEVISLGSVFEEVTRQREALADLRVFVRETTERHDQQLVELRQSLADAQAFLRSELPKLSAAAAAEGREMAGFREDQRRSVTAAEQSRTQHSLDVQQVISSNFSEMYRVLDQHRLQMDNLETGVRVVAEVVSNLADHFLEQD